VTKTPGLSALGGFGGRVGGGDGAAREKGRMDWPNRETWRGSTATTSEVVLLSALFTGSDCKNLAPNLGTSIALVIDSRIEGKRSVGSCRRIERGRLWMRSSILVGACLKTWKGLSQTGTL